MSEPLRVEPVEVEYYQDKSLVVLRIVRLVALVAIVYGSMNALSTGLQLLGTIMGFGYYHMLPAWYQAVALVGCVLSIVLVVSGVGCLTFRPAARKGMLVYAVASIAATVFVLGFTVVAGLGGMGRVPAGSSGLDTLTMVINQANSLVHGVVFPVIVLMILRMDEVRRVFTM